MSSKWLLKLPSPLHIIQDSRYAKQDGWLLDDISLCSSGNIAVSGHRPYQSYLCIYGSTVDETGSRDKPKLFGLYHKQFTDKDHRLLWRYISFTKPTFTEIVTCRHEEVQVIDYRRDVVLRSCKVNGWTRCLFVNDRQIFIGLWRSKTVNIYDNDLNEIKAIRFKGIEDDWPVDIAAAGDRVYVCTFGYNGTAIVYSQKSGSTLTEYTSEQYSSKALGIAVNKQLGLTAVLWNHDDTDKRQIIFYSLSENTLFLTVDVESGVSIIRISDQGRIATGNEDTGEVKIYNLARLFSYSDLKECLKSGLGRGDCKKLANFFAITGEDLNHILNNDRPASTLLLALEERGIIQPFNVNRLEGAFRGLELSSSFCHVVNMYQNLRDQITSYDRFLATLSSHLTSSIPAELCDYFHVYDEKRDSIISSQNPGLTLLLVLDEMRVIKPSEVGCLEKPLNKLKLLQAVAKIHQYQELLKEKKLQFLQKILPSLEDKEVMFVEFLKKKIKSWYETMTPVPWKKSCQWKSADLFVGSGLILTDSKAKQSVHNIDEQCKLEYTEIFSHEKLKGEIRIILEGDPGAGKTMLLSQLAFDWSEGKIDSVDMLIFLPLKIVEDKTLIQAVKEFYIPTDMPLSEKDIETIIGSSSVTTCFLLDGLEEYSTRERGDTKESSEVVKVMKKEKHSNCRVVISTRSEFAHDLPKCPLLIVGRFGAPQRDSYIRKLFTGNTDQQMETKITIQDNPFILDLCSVPLLFVLAVHNIESMSLSQDSQLNKVSPFMRNMILTLCPAATVLYEVDNVPSEFYKSEQITLGELAFNGLCKGHQQLSWQKDFVVSNVSDFKLWVDSGILVIEEAFTTADKNEQDVSETSAIHDKEFSGPSSSYDIPESQGLHEMSKTGLGASLDNPRVSEIGKPHHSVSKDENDPHVITEKSVRRTAGHVPLVVKFLHKVIQEWFAATFFSSKMKRCTNAVRLQNYLSGQLYYINPTDLHYVLRFTSYLHPPSCHHIMSYLLRSYRKDGCVPIYIMNCVFLCFHEHNDCKGPEMESVVTDVCKEVITMQSEDSRLLQQAKISLLEYASCHGVLIEKVELRDVISSVNHKYLTLNSGVQLGILETVKSIEVSSWGPVLQKHDYENIFKLLSRFTLLEEMCCYFPSAPPTVLDEVTLKNCKSKDLKAEWRFGHCVHSLDLREGKWMINVEQPDASTTRTTLVINCKYEKQMQQPSTSCVPGTSADSDSKFSKSQGTQEETEIYSIPDVAVTDKLSKAFKEQTPFGSVSKSQLADTLKKEKKMQTSTISCPHGHRASFNKYSFSPEIRKRKACDLKPEAVIPIKMDKLVSDESPTSDVGQSQWSDCQSLLEAKTIITKNGGIIEVPNAGVALMIPPGALPEGMENCEMHIRIIPEGHMEEQKMSFSSSSSTVVELLPDSLKFRQPVRLTVPHCLVFQDTGERKARIFVSHHGTESVPHWEEQTHLSYHLEDTACIIRLDSLCWIKVSVDDEIVKAKKLVVYTAVRRLHPLDKVAEIHVGYYMDLPDEKMIMNHARDLIVAQRKTFFYVRRKEKYPLRVSLDSVISSDWGYHSEEPRLREVTYEQVTSSLRYSVIYTLRKEGNTPENPLCVFTVSQESGQTEVQLAVHLNVTDGHMESSIKCLDQHGVPLKAEMKVSKAGGTLTIKDTDVKLEIPRDAIPPHREEISIRMTIIPTRVLEDQVSCFGVSSCTAVEIYPSNILLNSAAKLTLPHCLKLKKKKERKARIFINEEEGSPSLWKEQQHLKYELNDKACIVQLKKLCSVKYSIDENFIEGKRIILYTAAQSVKQEDTYAEGDVGYYSDVPGGGELLQLNPNLQIDSTREVLFMEKPKVGLKLFLNCVIPSEWKYYRLKKKRKKIPYNVIASSMEHSHLYVLKKEKDYYGSVICKFIASQKDSCMSCELSLRILPQNQPQNTGQSEKPAKRADPMTATFQYLSKKLGIHWKPVGRLLGLEDAVLESIEKDHAGTKEHIYQMLLEWKQEKGSKATHVNLIRSLTKAGRKKLADDLMNRKDQEDG